MTSIVQALRDMVDAKDDRPRAYYGKNAINLDYPAISEGTDPRAASIRIHRACMRARGTMLVVRMGADTLKKIGAKDLVKEVDDERGWGGVFFRVGKNPKKVTHVRVSYLASGHCEIEGLRFHKIPRVFEWQYDVVEKAKVADPDGADWSVVFGSILSLEMGRFVRYKFKVTDPMMTCPTCTKEFGPRHPSVYVKGDEDRIFCKKDCAKKWAGIPT